MSKREERIGRNEALFREVNERIERVTETLQVETLTILCECGDPSCFEQIEVSLPDYERVRADPTSFFIRAGHEDFDVEDVVEEHEDYHVVRKKDGSAAAQAHKLDPRDGVQKLLDVNARTWGYHSIGPRAGVDFPRLLAWYAGGQLDLSGTAYGPYAMPTKVAGGCRLRGRRPSSRR